MQNPVWKKTLADCADPDRARVNLDRLAATPLAVELEKTSPGQARLLAALLAGSQALSDALVAHPDWFPAALAEDVLQHPRREQGLRRELDQLLAPPLAQKDYAGAFTQIRLFKQREQMRIAARDLARLADLTATTLELSNLADVTLSAVLRICRQQLGEKHGQPWHLDPDGRWQPTQFGVIGLGKLGGQELNYSSDVDVMFIYSEEGHVFKVPPKRKTEPARALTNHQFFKRLVESFVAEIARPVAEGMLYRVDLRLRPEGDSGPLVRSLLSYENFYSQWGQTWERMMLIKARCVAGDAGIVAEFIEMIQPYRYPRSINPDALHEVAAMKLRTEDEVVRSGELDRNVKLGRGGIREIEFVAQSRQLLHAGRQPFLQGSQTLPMLRKLVQYNLLDEAESAELSAAYVFLRDVEHRLQMDENRQTHTIPTDEKFRERLARLMGCRDAEDFEKALRAHQAKVRRIYDRYFKFGPAEEKPLFPQQFAGAEAEWKKILADHRFRDADKAFKLLNEFVNGPGFIHVSKRTSELALRLLPRFLLLCPQPSAGPAVVPAPVPATASKAPIPAAGLGPLGRPVLSDPDRVLARLDAYITAYGARAMLMETWHQHSQIFDLLLLLFDRSEFLAETAIRTPDIVDELVLSGRLNRAKSAAETLADLRHGLRDPDQHLWLRRYHQTELMRIGLRHILGLADFEENLASVSALAEACLQYALEVTLLRQKWKSAPLVIIGLGKLGGSELNYGSDLDIVFVADAPDKDLPRLQKVAVDVLDLLSRRTELGIVFETDARLRPDGEKGLLVNTLAAHEEYYRHRAQLWEIQALTRTRPIAGDFGLGARYQQFVAAITNFTAENVAAGFPSRQSTTTAAGEKGGAKKKTSKSKAPAPAVGLAAYSPEWKEQIAKMRLRIEKERTPPGHDALAFKTGAGGLIDGEFVAQAMCLAHGWQEANTLGALARVRDSGVLPRDAAEKLHDNYRMLRRMEGILRRWSYEGEDVLPADPEPYYRVAVRCSYPTPEAFAGALAGWRRAIREVYRMVFDTPASLRS